MLCCILQINNPGFSHTTLQNITSLANQELNAFIIYIWKYDDNNIYGGGTKLVINICFNMM